MAVAGVVGGIRGWRMVTAGGAFGRPCGFVGVCVTCWGGGWLSFLSVFGVSGCLVGGAWGCFGVASVLLLSVFMVGGSWGLASFCVAGFFLAMM